MTFKHEGWLPGYADIDKYTYILLREVLMDKQIHISTKKFYKCTPELFLIDESNTGYLTLRWLLVITNEDESSMFRHKASDKFSFRQGQYDKENFLPLSPLRL